VAPGHFIREITGDHSLVDVNDFPTHWLSLGTTEEIINEKYKEKTIKTIEALLDDVREPSFDDRRRALKRIERLVEEVGMTLEDFGTNAAELAVIKESAMQNLAVNSYVLNTKWARYYYSEFLDALEDDTDDFAVELYRKLTEGSLSKAELAITGDSYRSIPYGGFDYTPWRLPRWWNRWNPITDPIEFGELDG